MFVRNAGELSVLFDRDPRAYHTLVRLLDEHNREPLFISDINVDTTRTLIDEAYTQVMNARYFVFTCEDDWAERTGSGLGDGIGLFKLLNGTLSSQSHYLFESEDLGELLNKEGITTVYTQHVPFEGLYGLQGYTDGDGDRYTYNILDPAYMSQLEQEGIEVVVLDD